MTNCIQCGTYIERIEESAVVDGGDRVHDWCLTKWAEGQPGSGASEERIRRERATSMPITTGFTVAAGQITKEIDVITSECVFGINLFKDLFGGIRDIVGGRAGAHQKALKDLRHTCLVELRMNAAEIGADAVIGIDLDYSEISGKNGGLLMLVASGTAVRLDMSAEQ